MVTDALKSSTAMSGAENHGPGTPSHKTSGAPEDIPGVNTEWDLSGDAFKDLGPYQVEEAFDPESWDLAIDDLCEGGMPKSVPPSGKRMSYLRRLDSTSAERWVVFT